MNKNAMNKLSRYRGYGALLPIVMLLALGLAGCDNSAKPVPVKDDKAPPPYAGHGMDAVGVGRDPSHHSPFGSATDTTGEPGRFQAPPPPDRRSDPGQ